MYMGVIYRFCCPNCNYELVVSKGWDRGKLAAVEPMICNQCSELQNIEVEYFNDWDTRKSTEKPIQECRECQSKDLRLWTDGNCPKCGTSLGDGEVYIMWD